jgi:RNA polymerase sigma factor (sigma-70 family)
METDADLVLAARRGSRDAFGQIFDRHWPRVWRAAYATIGDRELASDAAQDAFLRAASAFRRFDPRRPLEPWLVRIAVNRTVDLVRARRRLVSAELADERFAFDEPLPDEDLVIFFGAAHPWLPAHYAGEASEVAGATATAAAGEDARATARPCTTAERPSPAGPSRSTWCCRGSPR